MAFLEASIETALKRRGRRGSQRKPRAFLSLPSSAHSASSAFQKCFLILPRTDFGKGTPPPTPQLKRAKPKGPSPYSEQSGLIRKDPGNP